MKAILEHAVKLNLTYLAAVLENNFQNNIPTFIHLSCQDKLRNQSRPKRRLKATDPALSKCPARRSDVGDFDFKAQCFYCEKHVRQIFITLIERRLKLFPRQTKTYSGTLKICSSREDTHAKIERRMLSVCDLVVAEAHYHPVCRSNFKNLLPKQTSRGQPSSTEKLKAFETVCKCLEDEMELMTFAEFQTMMEKQHTNVYSVRYVVVEKILMQKLKDACCQYVI